MNPPPKGSRCSSDRPSRGFGQPVQTKTKTRRPTRVGETGLGAKASLSLSLEKGGSRWTLARKATATGGLRLLQSAPPLDNRPRPALHTEPCSSRRISELVAEAEAEAEAGAPHPRAWLVSSSFGEERRGEESRAEQRSALTHLKSCTALGGGQAHESSSSSRWLSLSLFCSLLLLVCVFFFCVFFGYFVAASSSAATPLPLPLCLFLCHSAATSDGGGGACSSRQ